MSELFDKKQWFGEFFLPEQYEKRFSGKIDYSPETGVDFSYFITSYQVPAHSDVLYGMLDDGSPCTLVGRFSPNITSPHLTMQNNIFTRRGNTHFDFLLLGKFVSTDELFYEVEFSLSNMQEFFFAGAHKDFQKYNDAPLLKKETPYGSIQIRHNSIHRILPPEFDIAAQIYSPDSIALDELRDQFKKLRSKYPESNFMLQKDLSYQINMKFDPGLSIDKIYAHIMNIADLFALLIYNPVYPNSIKIKTSSDNLPLVLLDVYPSLQLDRRTVKLCERERSHSFMPLTISNVNMNILLDNWLASFQDYSIITSIIQNTTGFTDKHSIYGSIVLYATQMESIAKNVQKDKKYEYCLHNYTSLQLINTLQQIIEVDVPGWGEKISDLRNEIAHVEKSKKSKLLLRSLSTRDLMIISQCLQLTIIGYIFSLLGIQKEIIDTYQDRFSMK